MGNWGICFAYNADNALHICQVGCDGSCLTLTRLSLAMGGDYLCSASNGVGHPAHASIHVTVLCE